MDKQHNTPDEELPPGALETDEVLVRTLKEEDLDRIVRIDAQSMGRTRKAFFKTKTNEALKGGSMQVSLVAELDDHVVGFILALLYYGEFGRSEPIAIIDSVGVDEGYRRRKVGDALMAQLTMNLRAANVEHVETSVDWDDQRLVGFFGHHGFKPVPRLWLRREL